MNNFEPAGWPDANDRTFGSTRLRVKQVIGVDFSGAAEAGRLIWLSVCDVRGDRLALRKLARLDDLAGTAERHAALGFLRDAILGSTDALWGIDCPFGLPVELGWDDWESQLDAVGSWTRGANEFGRHCCALSMKAMGKLHTRRDTDRETKTPFDCYHYRIIHQTFHGMRELVPPLRSAPRTCVLPFQVSKLKSAERVIVESCPGSTLRRLGLPYNRYKQSGGAPVTAKHRKVRRAIFAGIAPLIEIDERDRRTMASDPGGDALDSSLAAVGAWHGWRTIDLRSIAEHLRYRHEGRIYC